jgi:hypothetical protein
MMDRRRTYLIISIGSIAGCLLVLAYMVFSHNFPRQSQPLARTDGDETDAPEPAATALDARVMETVAGLEPAAQRRMGKMVDVSMGTRLERTVTLCLAGAALDVVHERVQPATSLSADADFLRTQLQKAANRLLADDLSQERIQRLAAMTMAITRDRNISGRELSTVVGLYNRELGLDLDETRVAEILEHLRQPETRKELKRVLQVETGTIVKKMRSNPLTGRLVVAFAEKAFTAYQNEIFSRLPPQVDRQEVRRLALSTLESLISNSLSNNEIDAICGLCVESLADRQISLMELERIAQSAASALEIPALKKLEKKY